MDARHVWGLLRAQAHRLTGDHAYGLPETARHFDLPDGALVRNYRPHFVVNPEVDHLVRIYPVFHGIVSGGDPEKRATWDWDPEARACDAAQDQILDLATEAVAEAFPEHGRSEREVRSIRSVLWAITSETFPQFPLELDWRDAPLMRMRGEVRIEVESKTADVAPYYPTVGPIDLRNLFDEAQEDHRKVGGFSTADCLSFYDLDAAHSDALEAILEGLVAEEYVEAVDTGRVRRYRTMGDRLGRNHGPLAILKHMREAPRGTLFGSRRLEAEGFDHSTAAKQLHDLANAGLIDRAGKDYIINDVEPLAVVLAQLAHLVVQDKHVKVETFLQNLRPGIDPTTRLETPAHPLWHLKAPTLLRLLDKARASRLLARQDDTTPRSVEPQDRITLTDEGWLRLASCSNCGGAWNDHELILTAMEDATLSEQWRRADHATCPRRPESARQLVDRYEFRSQWCGTCNRHLRPAPPVTLRDLETRERTIDIHGIDTIVSIHQRLCKIADDLEQSAMTGASPASIEAAMTSLTSSDVSVRVGAYVSLAQGLATLDLTRAENASSCILALHYAARAIRPHPQDNRLLSGFHWNFREIEASDLDFYATRLLEVAQGYSGSHLPLAARGIYQRGRFHHVACAQGANASAP